MPGRQQPPAPPTHMWERLVSFWKVRLWMLGISSPSKLLQKETSTGEAVSGPGLILGLPQSMLRDSQRP